MFFLTPILAGIILAGTLGAGAYTRHEASDVIAKYNLAQIGHLLEINYAENGRYPSTFDQLLNGGELKNINSDNYKYNVSENGQSASLYGYQNQFCWNTNDLILKRTDVSECIPKFID